MTSICMSSNLLRNIVFHKNVEKHELFVEIKSKIDLQVGNGGLYDEFSGKSGRHTRKINTTTTLKNLPYRRRRGRKGKRWITSKESLMISVG